MRTNYNKTCIQFQDRLRIWLKCHSECCSKWCVFNIRKSLTLCYKDRNVQWLCLVLVLLLNFCWKNLVFTRNYLQSMYENGTISLETNIIHFTHSMAFGSIWLNILFSSYDKLYNKLSFTHNEFLVLNVFSHSIFVFDSIGVRPYQQLKPLKSSRAIENVIWYSIWQYNIRFQRWLVNSPFIVYF